MADKKIFLTLSLIVVLSVLALSCKTLPSKQETTGGTQSLNHVRISQAVYDSTREEVRHFIERLNQIIRTRDYTAWTRTLSQEYIDLYSSQQKLREISEEPLMKRAGIVLRNLNDYFTRVFIPARNPDRIQIDNIDIEFVTVNRVRAFTTRTNSAGEELREILYDLEKINNDWKIIN